MDNDKTEEAEELNVNHSEMFSRFSDVVSADDVDKLQIHIVGCGAIGSQVAMNLRKMGVTDMVLWDHDTLEVANVGVQGYPLGSVGKGKVKALQDLLTYFVPEQGGVKEIKTVPKKFNKERYELLRSESDRYGIVFMCVDSMDARKEIAEAVSDNSDEVITSLVVDGRMAAEVLQVFAFSPDTIEKYDKTTFSDDEGYSERCTAKSTIYTASLAGSLMVGTFKYWLVNSGMEKNHWDSYQWSLDTNRITRLESEAS